MTIALIDTRIPYTLYWCLIYVEDGIRYLIEHKYYDKLIEGHKNTILSEKQTLLQKDNNNSKIEEMNNKLNTLETLSQLNVKIGDKTVNRT